VEKELQNMMVILSSGRDGGVPPAMRSSTCDGVKMQSLKPDEFDRFGEVMGFTLMNGKRVAIKTKLVKRIITTELSNQIYWMHNGMLTEDLVMRYLNPKEEVIYDHELKKVAYYILFFAENLIFTNILFTASEGEKEMQDYIKTHIPLLEKLRELYKGFDKIEALYELSEDEQDALAGQVPSAWGIVTRMMELCLDMGIDPL